MALNLDAVGKTFVPMSKDYTWKDVVLYALGVGAGFSDLEYCYEKDLKVIPSFSIATIFDILMQRSWNRPNQPGRRASRRTGTDLSQPHTRRRAP